MNRILLIRHGNTDLLREYLCGRTPGISLNQEGRAQARELSQNLLGRYKFSAVYSSPLERAMETAGFIAGAAGLNVIRNDGVNEIDFGAWTGMRFADLHNLQEWRDYNGNRALSSAPGGETLTEVQTRAWKSLHKIALDHIARDHGSQTVAIVSHGDVIRALLILLLGMPLDHILRFEISPASFTEISLGPAGPVIHAINSQCY